MSARLAARRRSTGKAIALERVFEDELRWFFGYACFALRRDDVVLMPTHALRLLPAAPTDELCRGRAARMARAVQACLASLPARHAAVLRATYTPRRWPATVVRAFDVLSPIVVRLAVARSPWPRVMGRAGLEEAAARRLSAAIEGRRKVALRRLDRRARGLLSRALIAYTTVRTQGGASRGGR